MLSDIEHLRLETNGIRLHVATLGEGPLVVMCHGFPGLWYSWRKQLPAIAAAGFRAVAVDMRGYGRSDRPGDTAAYNSETLPASTVWMRTGEYLYQEYTCTGAETAFIGGLSAYRVADRNWEIAKRYQGINVLAPVLFLMGEQDPVREMMPAAAFEHMQAGVPALQGPYYIPDAGHFVMQENPEPVNDLILPFLQQHAGATGG